MSEINLSFDENKFKKIKVDREDWLIKGKEILDINSDMASLVESCLPTNIVLDVREIEKINSDIKILTLASLDGSSLPPFKAGQYIDIDLKVKDMRYNDSFAILSSPKDALAGTYKIFVKKGLNEVHDYLFKVKKSEELKVSKPYGDFYYNSIRDKKDVIAIVNEFGVLPILSMAKSISDGVESFNLTIFYSAKNKEELLFEEELRHISNECLNVDVKFVLFEEAEGYLNGYVTLDMIRNVMSDVNSFFMSGTEGLLKYLDTELMDLELPKKFFRYDKYFPRCNIKKEQEYNLSIYIKSEKYEVKCYNNKTIINSILEAGVDLKDCLDGSYLRCELVSGKVKVINDIRTAIEKQYNFIHPAMTYPMGDIEIIVR
ncbi:MAG: FAD-dependent oxidoreductase [Bacilli bacterium]|nr:FAD-dependent oxidoreductase [Bacilli bacterium]